MTLERENQHDWHALSPHEVLQILGTNEETGLSSSEAISRSRQYGPNSLPDQPQASFVGIFFKQFRSPLIYLLLGAAMVAFLLDEVSDASVILVVVILNSIIGAIQEGRAERSLESLKRLSKQMVTVRRDGKEKSIEARELVPGDILVLSAGDAIAADARVLSAHEIGVSEASLTGESLPVGKTIEVLDAETVLADRRNMVFSGTFANSGRARAVVTTTGPRTEVGKVARLATEGKEPATPLERKVAQFGKMIIFAACGVFLLILGVGWLRGMELSQIFMVGISQVVSMVPEGLPVAITVALAVGVRRMANRGAIIRRLAAVETLGSTSVICTDKTGTLTRNEMTVREVYVATGSSAGILLQVSGTGYSPEGEFHVLGSENISPTDDPNLMSLLKAGTLCNDSHLVPPGEKVSSWSIQGDPTEGALLSLAGKIGIRREELEKKFPRTNEIPFDSSTKLMATEHSHDGKTIVFVKGAPEQILRLCGDAGPALEIADEMARRALRVLAFAQIEGMTLSQFKGFAGMTGALQFLGLMGQMDPPREEVHQAVQDCQAAGIRPVMVTGDHKQTGFAIGSILGIVRPGDEAIDGVDLEKMSEAELDKRIEKISVFARVLPEQKLRIVEAFQRAGNVVAMTGDGVNDAPALARADVGVAMGISGTETAKEAAKIVLTDDNFATIVQAVRQGRLVYRNVKKLILYLFTTGLSELIVLFGALLFGYPPPLAAVQILWINLVTDGALTFTLIMEPEEGDEMKHKPISRAEPLVNRMMAKRMLFLSPAIAVSTLGYFVYGLSTGRPFAEVQTGTFTVLAVSQWFNALNCRSHWQSAFKMNLFRNKWLIGGLLVGNVLQASVIYLPFMNSVFGTTPIPLKEAIVIGLVASLVFWVEEARKFFTLSERRLPGVHP